jgi:hypothetical protein
MQVLQAGEHKFLLLELDPELVANIAKQAGFEYRIEENARSVSLDSLPDARRRCCFSMPPTPATWGGSHAASFM